MNKTRMEAFSDGIFAIIITIMVLELKSPRSAEWSELTREYPVFLGYGIAIPFSYLATAASESIFILVAAMWLLPDRGLEKAVE